MLDTLNRHLLHPLMAWRAGSSHLRHLRRLRRTQFDAPEVTRARQLEALKASFENGVVLQDYEVFVKSLKDF